MPQIGVFPMAELPTGNSDKGLGNGKTWWRLPIWIQKSWGDWTSYGGGGYVINHADGQKDYPFGGWLLQKDFGEKWTLGGEVFARGKDKITAKRLSNPIPTRPLAARRQPLRPELIQTQLLI